MSEIAAKRVTDRQWRQFVESYVVIRRWGLDHFVDPNDEAQIVSELIKLQNRDNSIFFNDLRYQDADRHESQIDPGKFSFVAIYIDLHQPDIYLKEQFIQKVHAERKKYGITSRRSKASEEDIWRVWDMREVQKKGFREIAGNLCGQFGNPVDDDPAKRACDRLQRAHKKAARFIKEVGDSRNPSITYEVVETSLIRDIKALFQKVSRIRS